jgi:hypothetical protein
MVGGFSESQASCEFSLTTIPAVKVGSHDAAPCVSTSGNDRIGSVETKGYGSAHGRPLVQIFLVRVADWLMTIHQHERCIGP